MILVIVLVMLAGIMPASSNVLMNAELTLFYENCINCIAAKSEKYVILVNSDSEYIRSYASAMLKKAAFLKKNQNKLVHEMVVQDIGKHPRAIEFYLNQKFFNALKAAKHRKSSEFVN
jgi:hypothetical protein